MGVFYSEMQFFYSELIRTGGFAVCVAFSGKDSCNQTNVSVWWKELVVMERPSDIKWGGWGNRGRAASFKMHISVNIDWGSCLGFERVLCVCVWESESLQAGVACVNSSLMIGLEKLTAQSTVCLWPTTTNWQHITEKQGWRTCIYVCVCVCGHANVKVWGWRLAGFYNIVTSGRGEKGARKGGEWKKGLGNKDRHAHTLPAHWQHVPSLLLLSLLLFSFPLSMR